MSDEVWLIARVLSAAAAIVAVFFTWRAWRFTSRAARATGTITRNAREEVETQSYGADHPAQTSLWYRPHVSFSDASGAAHGFASRVAHPSAPRWEAGTTVSVLYERSDPAGTAEIEGAAVWRPAIFAVIGAAGVILFTLIGRACG